MEALAQLERDYQKAKEKGARPELLRKLEDQISRLKPEESPGQEDIPFIGEGPFEDLFKKAVDEINKRYPEGTLEHIKLNHRRLYDDIDRAEDRLNEVWKAGLNGGASLKEFREVLKRWYLLHIKAIEIYRDESKEVSGDRIKETASSE